MNNFWKKKKVFIYAISFIYKCNGLIFFHNMSPLTFLARVAKFLPLQIKQYPITITLNFNIGVTYPRRDRKIDRVRETDWQRNTFKRGVRQTETDIQTEFDRQR